MGLPKLVELRRRRYLSQAELAEKSGVAKNTIHRLETGDATPQLRTIRKLAEALGVTPDELTGKVPLAG
jgi:transcriptional regulator with XRE-family HTH domain